MLTRSCSFKYNFWYNNVPHFQQTKLPGIEWRLLDIMLQNLEWAAKPFQESNSFQSISEWISSWNGSSCHCISCAWFKKNVLILFALFVKIEDRYMCYLNFASFCVSYLYWYFLFIYVDIYLLLNYATVRPLIYCYCFSWSWLVLRVQSFSVD